MSETAGLVAALRSRRIVGLNNDGTGGADRVCHEAADRIEALTRERDEALLKLKRQAEISELDGVARACETRKAGLWLGAAGWWV